MGGVCLNKRKDHISEQWNEWMVSGGGSHSGYNNSLPENRVPTQEIL